MVTHEGGTIPEENLTNYNVDRVKTLGEAVLGLTLGCASATTTSTIRSRSATITSSSPTSIRSATSAWTATAGSIRGRCLEARTVLATGEVAGAASSELRLREAACASRCEAVAAWEGSNARS